MDTETTEQVSAEELAAEQADATIPTEDQVRAQIIEDTGFDPEDPDQKEKIDKLVKRDMGQREKTSKAIRGKINWREKATKKEPKPNDPPPPKDPKEDKDLSTDDVYALVQAQVPREDVDEVKRVAKVLGKSISDTLSDQMMQGILKDRKEKRASAEAANRGGGHGGNKKPSDAEILERARNGEVFEQGTPEAEQLFWARRGGKR